MNLREAADLLAKIQAYDRRTIEAPTIAAWASALADVPFDAASQAVDEHFAASTDWLMPGHVKRLISERLRRLLADAGPPDFPEAFGDLPPAEQQAAEKAYRLTYHEALLAGADRDTAHRLTDRTFTVIRPELRRRPVDRLILGKKP